MEKIRIRDILTVLIIIIPFWGFLFETQAVRDTIGETLTLCGRVLIPSMFPCMVMTNLLLETGVAGYLGSPFEKIMRPLFRLPGECAPVLLMGAAAGYPVGARGAILLYEKGEISKSECERLMAFCNNSGPTFLFGTLGLTIFSSTGVGWILTISHVAVSLTVGIFSRFYKSREEVEIFHRQKAKGINLTARSFTQSVSKATESLIHMTAYVLFFSASSCVLSESGFLPMLSLRLSEWSGLSKMKTEAFLTGLIEMTGGLFRLTPEEGGMTSSLTLAAFLVGWAGFSVHFQVLSFLGENRLSMAPYFMGKLLHGGISALYTLLLSRLVCVETGTETVRLATVGGERLFIISLLVGITVPLLLLCCVVLRKRDFDK